MVVFVALLVMSCVFSTVFRVFAPVLVKCLVVLSAV